MPIHDFQCINCGYSWEDLQPYDVTPLCPMCGSAFTNRLVSAPKAHGLQGLPTEKEVRIPSEPTKVYTG